MRYDDIDAAVLALLQGLPSSPTIEETGLYPVQENNVGFLPKVTYEVTEDEVLEDTIEDQEREISIKLIVVATSKIGRNALIAELETALKEGPPLLRVWRAVKTNLGVDASTETTIWAAELEYAGQATVTTI